MAENQRRNKELAALGEGKGTEGTRRFEQESKDYYNSEHWAGAAGEAGVEGIGENTRAEEGTPEPLCMQMRDIPQVYTKTKFGSTDCFQKQGCHLRARATMETSRRSRLASGEGPSMSHSMGHHCSRHGLGFDFSSAYSKSIPWQL